MMLIAKKQITKYRFELRFITFPNLAKHLARMRDQRPLTHSVVPHISSDEWMISHFLHTDRTPWRRGGQSPLTPNENETTAAVCNHIAEIKSGLFAWLPLLRSADG